MGPRDLDSRRNAFDAPGSRRAARSGLAERRLHPGRRLGWGDLGCYGNREIRTPNLDRLARQGTLFTQFYVNGSVCSPSRTAFITGQFPARHRDPRPPRRPPS